MFLIMFNKNLVIEMILRFFLIFKEKEEIMEECLYFFIFNSE